MVREQILERLRQEIHHADGLPPSKRAELCGALGTEPAEDYYKALYEVKRGWRDLKHTIDMRPADHRREDRIEAHVQLCWLALLLMRVAETEAGDTWRNLRNELDRMHLVTLATPKGPSANAPS